MDTQDWRRLNQLADQLEEAWTKAEDVDLSQFLPPGGDPMRTAVLHELITTDLEIRWRRKQGRPLEFYVALYPDLQSTTALPPKLIYEEYRVRCRHGDRPDIAVYRQRFPDQYAHLQKLLQQDPIATLQTNVSTPAAAPPPPATSARPVDNTQTLMIGGGYKLEKLIGRGGFGEVYRAIAPGGFPAAIKVITRPADHEERIREERALNVIKQLNHHFLIKTIASWSDEEKLYIVMDLADSSLRERFKQCKGMKTDFPLEELLRFFRESAEALDYLHEQDVLHRDIKPDNILLVGHHVRLADFGLARHQEQILASASGAGTPAYMAPEVWRGKASKFSDQYSLAYTYAEMRLGRRPFSSTDYAGVMFDHLDNKPNLDPLSELEQQILLQSLAKKPEERFPTCLLWVEALEDLFGIVPRGSRQVPTIRKEAPPTMKDRSDQPATLGGGGGAAAATAQRPEGMSPETTAFNSLLPNQLSEKRASVTAPLPKKTTAAPKVRTRSKLPFVILGVLFVAILGVVAAVIVPGLISKNKVNPESAFTLTAPPTVTLRPGEKQNIAIGIVRRNLTEPIHLTFETPPYVTLDPVTVPGDADSVDAVLSVAAGAAAGQGKIIVHAKSGSLTQDGDFTVTIEAPPAPPWLPENYKPAADSRIVTIRGRSYHDRIVSDRPGVPPATFVLIWQEGKSDLPPFYLMDTKVSSALAAALAKQVGGIQASWAADGDKGDLPAFGMTADEAYRMARELGGLLPTKGQWDRAAGFEAANRPSPFVGGPDAAVNRWKEGSRSVKDHRDISAFKVFDMGGNGTELTSDLTAETEATRKWLAGKTIPLKDAPADVLVILRGQRYTAPQPLRFADLAEQQALPQVQFYGARSPYTGFRVAIQPPQ